ncbi:MAG: murein hydrolase activator EnvC family protein [Myxococcota bacterium]
MRCDRHDGRRFCDGPRRVPRGYGLAAARAERLGLGTWPVAAKLLRSEPRPEWRRATGTLGIEAPKVLMWPVDGAPFGRGFGAVAGRDGARHVHEGVDVAGLDGQPVRAVAGGLVAYADNGVRGLGNLVLVLHGGTTVGVYAHLQEAHVGPGERIGRGHILGRVGATGLTRGPHLHFEWRTRGRPVDPAPRFH